MYFRQILNIIHFLHSKKQNLQPAGEKSPAACYDFLHGKNDPFKILHIKPSPCPLPKGEGGELTLTPFSLWAGRKQASCSPLQPWEKGWG